VRDPTRGIRHSPRVFSSGSFLPTRKEVTRAGRLSIALIALAFAGVAVGPADADIVIDVPGVTKTVPVPPVNVPTGRGPLKVQVPIIEVKVPRDGSRPSGNVGPGNAGPTPTPPVSTPPTPDPPADPPANNQPATTATPATTTDTPATDTQPAASTTASHTPAPKSVPIAQSHTIAPLTRSGSSAPRRRTTKKSSPATAPKTKFVAEVTAPAATTPRATKRAPRPAAPAKQVSKPHAPMTLGTAIGEVVDGLPGWVLGIFVGFAALAAAMAINAYLSSRRARRLAAQRAELVDDVGHLQAALLAPVASAHADVSLSVAYRPAAGLAAGGDFYDVFELDSDRTAMLLGDVSGHGRESVAHAALVRYTLRTFIAAGHEPAQAIALTDPCLDGHMDDQFATVIAAVYDHGAHTITYAKAGHYPPLVLGVDDDSTVASSSPPIGAGLGAHPSNVTLEIEPGATVCFFTDGLVEARRNGVQIGPERVERMLADAPEDAEALIAAVAAEADKLNDDVAVCVLHRPAEVRSVATHAGTLAHVPQPVAG
jgi:Stage II sporulation protein E (SpoIIE)